MSFAAYTMATIERTLDALHRLREQAPLIHNITNYVVMNTTANALLAVGASPAMVHAVEEVEEFVELSAALVVNPGTLSSDWVRAMDRACATANRLGKPWVLDPVGVGATSYRTATNRALLAHRPTVVRCNASEVMALASAAFGPTKGVDSTHSTDQAFDAAVGLAKSVGTTVSVSGAVDLITDGKRVMRVSNGHPMMPRVTGLGCTATALTGAFLAVEEDHLWAATHALVVLGYAGERAAALARGPGSLQMHLIDELYALDEDALRSGARLSLSLS